MFDLVVEVFPFRTRALCGYLYMYVYIYIYVHARGLQLHLGLRFIGFSTMTTYSSLLSRLGNPQALTADVKNLNPFIEPDCRE